MIIDHHQPGAQIPDVTAMVNPLRADCRYPFNGFWEVAGKVYYDLLQELDLVAFATIADRMSLIDENRFLVKLGLELMNPCPRPRGPSLTKSLWSTRTGGFFREQFQTCAEY